MIDLLESLQIVIRFLFLDHLDESLQVVMFKWLNSTQHHIQDDASTPYVDFVSVGLTREHFGSTELHDTCIGLHDFLLLIMLPSHIEVDDE